MRLIRLASLKPTRAAGPIARRLLAVLVFSFASKSAGAEPTERAVYALYISQIVVTPEMVALGRVPFSFDITARDGAAFELRISSQFLPKEFGEPRGRRLLIRSDPTPDRPKELSAWMTTTPKREVVISVPDEKKTIAVKVLGLSAHDA